MKRNDVISIVVPVFNEEILFSDCLRTLQSQERQSFEIIVVDNGSTDRTLEIAHAFGIRVVISPIQRNVFVARDFGTRVATGEIIAQADADTMYPSNWLSHIVQQLELYPNAVGIAGRFEYTEPARFSRIELGLRDVTNRVSARVLKRPSFPSGANFAFRRDTFQRAGGYDFQSYAPDQYGIAVRLKKFGPVLYDPSLVVVTSPRRHQRSAMGIVRAVTQNLLTVVRHSI